MHSAVLVTGASRGFGRCLALDFARELVSSDLDLFLWARDENGLKETSRLVREARDSLQQAEDLHIFIQPVDLRDSADYTKKLDDLLAQLTTAAPYDRVFLVHNAGALGGLGFAQECPSPSEMARHFELNVTSVMWLNKRILDVFGASRRDITKLPVSDTTTKLVIFNVSSRSAIAPYPTLSQYCTAKAAREMHFRVLAAEQAACNKVRVFSYSPGAMDTEMQQTMRTSPLMAPELTKWFVEMKEQGTLVPTQQSSHRGVVAAVNGDFETGKHVSFDDLKYVEERSLGGAK
ncbi:Sepiapterin reductase [Phytophthora nicotianae]|uniref:Echinoderm microtubule-associated protein 2 n=1 Tax=Phytophthora nicotianae TaxID=4792 RepID=A0A0W8CZG4_PHYNI|nr:Echinoderm microtubule-associated protein 2 [Phytophthora nicotianae]KUF97988.1 Sepiapterin reductase [Phytophthora nicotianae]